jgi:hypothetical protein
MAKFSTNYYARELHASFLPIHRDRNFAYRSQILEPADLEVPLEVDDHSA